jgi:hypothetical protein
MQLLLDRAVNDFDFKLFAKQTVMRNRVDSRGIEPIHARTSDKLWGMVSVNATKMPMPSLITLV